MVLSFLAAAFTLALELKRKEKEGLLTPTNKKVLIGLPASAADLISTGIIGFIIGYKFLGIILNFSTVSNNPQQFLLSWDGSVLGGIVFAALSVYLKYREKNKEKLATPKWIEETVHPYQLVGNITMVAAVAGLLGAKIFHNLENLDDFFADPIGALLSFSGLTMYGGLIVGGAAVIYYALKNKISFEHILDATAPGLMLSYGIGRIGCQVAGDGDWGIDNLIPKPNWMSFLPDWLWSYRYPHNVNNIGISIPDCLGRHCNMLAHPVFPTPLYESIICIALFFILWTIRKRIKIHGILFSIYLLFNGTERFFIEKIRINTLYHIFGHGITQAEIISTFLFILGIFGVWYFGKQKLKGSSEN